MANVRAESPYAGMTVKTKTGMDFIVEDWWQNVYGKSWMLSDGNFAAMKYGVHAAMANLPIDNEVGCDREIGLNENEDNILDMLWCCSMGHSLTMV